VEWGGKRFPWKNRKRENHITWKLNSFIFMTLLFPFYLSHFLGMWLENLFFISSWSLFYGKYSNNTLTHDFTLLSLPFYRQLKSPFFLSWYCNRTGSKLHLAVAYYVSFLIYLNLSPNIKHAIKKCWKINDMRVYEQFYWSQC
jgi:hypothetical protein